MVKTACHLLRAMTKTTPSLVYLFVQYNKHNAVSVKRRSRKNGVGVYLFQSIRLLNAVMTKKNGICVWVWHRELPDVIKG
jgi:hypothetical protein